MDTVGGYSAHADKADLVGFVTRMKEWPKEIRLIQDTIRPSTYWPKCCACGIASRETTEKLPFR
ncbi:MULTISPECIES: MBL fold metallo-hydrolase RNA specificity domain-containing protein [Stutzerimonas stutzeri subgroup]|uniref:MBL fold metallo-hydrolase RNA specificity domain-containing protein n=1 Tax=Stutzerimonas stutzeri subgroup TaxID=578833 RepID=UPI0028B13C4F|nr:MULTISPECIES: MBL fold metallo-hydrolase RNA specificity domain-containing protein [Stutzerimonas stutzeri subgroup]